MSLGFLELTDTVVSGLTEYLTLAAISFTAATSDTNAVNNVALASLVTKSACLVNS